MKRRPWLVTSIVIVALLVAYRVNSMRQGTTRGADAISQAVPVETATVTVGNLDELARLTGNIEPIQSVQVIARVRGRIAEIHKSIGDQVSAGEALALIDPVDYGLDVKRLEGILAQARASFEQSERDAARSQKLFKDNVISTQALQAALSGEKVSAGRVKEAEAALELARRRLADTGVTSPIDGTVSQRYIDVGTMVETQIMGSRQAVAIYEVQNLARVKLTVGITENDLPRVKEGQRAIVSLRALPGRTFEGVLTHFSPSLAEGTRRAEAEIEIENPEHVLKPGMFATANLVLERHEGVTLIPKAAVVDREGKVVVFVVEDAKARMTPVSLGGADDLNAIVASGLEPGARLIVQGQTVVEDGTPVRPEGETGAKATSRAESADTAF
ncbi:MAG: efflux RND transporter periplasmic adaptor subunit [Deltaproteobacteria bacterium]|nr:efflux RND transporter periplasmic adaptor subunit [Deltaproteobacteria bacterium]